MGERIYQKSCPVTHRSQKVPEMFKTQPFPHQTTNKKATGGNWREMRKESTSALSISPSSLQIDYLAGLAVESRIVKCTFTTKGLH